MIMKKIKVTLRTKSISKGRLSLYLDLYPPYFNARTGEYSRREFLRLHLIAKPKSQADKIINHENWHTAELICAKRQNEVNKEHIYTPFEIEQLKKQKVMEASFLDYFRKQADLKEGNNRIIWDSSIAHFEIFRAGKPTAFNDITVELAEGFKAYLLCAKSLRENGKPLSRNTALSYFNKLKATLRKAYKQQMLQNDINAAVDSIPEYEAKRDFLTREEAIALFHAPCKKEIVKRISLFSILTGLRYSDIAKLSWGEVHYSKSTGAGISFRQEKTEGWELLPISDEAYTLLGERRDDTEKVFSGLNKWDVDRILPVWVAEAGIKKHITFHCFRHTYATLQVSAGTDIFTVSKMLGHKNVRTTQVYARLVDEKKRAAAGKITFVSENKISGC